MTDASICDSCGDPVTPGAPVKVESTGHSWLADGGDKLVTSGPRKQSVDVPSGGHEHGQYPTAPKVLDLCLSCYMDQFHEVVEDTFFATVKRNRPPFDESVSLQEAYADGGLRAEAGLDFTKTAEWSDEKRAALAGELGDLSDAQGVRTDFTDSEDSSGEKPQPPSSDKVRSRRTGMVYDKREKPIAGLALMLIDDSAGVTAKALSNQLDANIATIRTSLDRFEEEHAVEPEERDGKTYYTITDHGESVLETYEQVWKEGKKNLPQGFWD